MIRDEVIAQAMLAMGWNIDSEIPMANAENLNILKEMEALVEEKNDLLDAQAQTEERVEKLQQHAKNAEVSIDHNLKLLQAYQAEVRTESHLFKLVEREHSKLKEEIKNMEKEQSYQKKYLDATEKEVCKRRYRIDDMTNRIKWAKNAMTEWREAMVEGHKGYMLIEKYFQEDQQKAKIQDLRRQKLLSDIDEARKELIELSDEQKALELGLECSANLYRTAHAERRQMVETWKQAVSQMMQRENDIRSGEMEFLNLKTEAKKKAESLKSYNNKLNEIIENNREVEEAIEEINEETSHLKEQIQKLIDAVILKENEVDIMQKELAGIANRVQQQRAENLQNTKMLQHREKSLEDYQEVINKLEERFLAMENKTMSAQQRLQMLEEMMDGEQKTQGILNKETQKINDLKFRTQQQLTKFRDELKILEVENEGLKVTIVAIQRNTAETEKKLKRQTEIHYEQSFKCLKVERQINHLTGGSVDPELEQKNLEYLLALEEQYSKVMRRLQTTEAQNVKLDDNMRALTISYNKDIKEVEIMNFRIKEAQVYCAGGVKRLKSETRQNQVLMVDLSILKMRANEFEEEIARCEESTYNLEKHRMQLNRTIKDRMVEIRSQMELLILKRKHLTEEKATLRADIGERNIRISAVKGRFELTSQLLGKNEDGSLITATQLKVSMAQEKQMLLEEGNTLNARVLKAEEEIKAMENTLLMMNSSNDSYRKNFKHAQDAEATLVEIQTLQNNYCKALARLKNVRHKILHLEKENDKAAKKKEELEATLEITISRKLENTETLNKLQKDLIDQKVKLQRAEREMKLSVKSLRQRAISSEFLQLFDRDLDLRELENRNTNALNQLADMADSDDDIGPKVIRLLAEKNLKMPHQMQKSRSYASWRSEFSDISYSSREPQQSTSRSSISDGSHSQQLLSSTRLSVVSIDFKEPN